MIKYMAARLMAGIMLLGVASASADDVKPLTMDGHKYYLHVPRSVVKVVPNDTLAVTNAGLLLWLHSGGIGAKDQFDWCSRANSSTRRSSFFVRRPWTLPTDGMWNET